MEPPKQPTLEQNLQFCREILQTVNGLGAGEVCCVWFKTGARRKAIADLLNTRYYLADSDRVELNLYH
jgi:hypothetical protein